MTDRCLMLTVARITEVEPDESEFSALPQAVRRAVAQANQRHHNTTSTGLLLSNLSLRNTLLTLREHETAFKAATGRTISLRVVGYTETSEPLPQSESARELHEAHGIETIDTLIAVTAKCKAAACRAARNGSTGVTPDHTDRPL